MNLCYFRSCKKSRIIVQNKNQGYVHKISRILVLNKNQGYVHCAVGPYTFDNTKIIFKKFLLQFQKHEVNL